MVLLLSFPHLLAIACHYTLSISSLSFPPFFVRLLLTVT